MINISISIPCLFPRGIHYFCVITQLFDNEVCITSDLYLLHQYFMEMLLIRLKTELV